MNFLSAKKTDGVSRSTAVAMADANPLQTGLEKVESIGSELLKCTHDSTEHRTLEQNLVQLLITQSPQNLPKVTGKAIELGHEFAIRGGNDIEANPNDKNKMAIAYDIFQAISRTLETLSSTTNLIECQEIKTYLRLLEGCSAEQHPVDVIQAIHKRENCPLATLFCADQLINSEPLEAADRELTKQLFDRAIQGINEDSHLKYLNLAPYVKRVKEQCIRHGAIRDAGRPGSVPEPLSRAPVVLSHSPVVCDPGAIWTGSTLRSQFNQLHFPKHIPMHPKQVEELIQSAKKGSTLAAMHLVIESVRSGDSVAMEKYAKKTGKSVEEQRELHCLRFIMMLDSMKPGRADKQFYESLFFDKPTKHITPNEFLGFMGRLNSALEGGHRVAGLLLVRLYVHYPYFDKEAKNLAVSHLSKISKLEGSDEERRILSERVLSITTGVAPVRNEGDSTKVRKSFSGHVLSPILGKKEGTHKSDVRISDASRDGLSRHASSGLAASLIQNNTKVQQPVRPALSAPGIHARRGSDQHPGQGRPSPVPGVAVSGELTGQPVPVKKHVPGGVRVLPPTPQPLNPDDEKTR